MRRSKYEKFSYPPRSTSFDFFLLFIIYYLLFIINYIKINIFYK